MTGYKITNGDHPVLKMANITIEGNIIPLMWYQKICYTTGEKRKGKPYSIAITLLADIVYWYRPIAIRDEQTGRQVGFMKKFKADKLQRSYNQFAELYGYSKKQVRDALTFLQDEIGAIDLDFRHPEISGKKFGNLLFVGINPEVIRSLVSSTPLSPNWETPYRPIGRHPIAQLGDTNTETTTETTTNKNYVLFLETWEKHFPRKPQPRSNNRTLQGKLKTRLVRTHFNENWEKALLRASKSDFLASSSWFDAAWFLKNDDNYEKCLNGNYDNRVGYTASDIASHKHTAVPAEAEAEPLFY